MYFTAKNMKYIVWDLSFKEKKIESIFNYFLSYKAINRVNIIFCESNYRILCKYCSWPDLDKNCNENVYDFYGLVTKVILEEVGCSERKCFAI